MVRRMCKNYIHLNKLRTDVYKSQDSGWVKCLVSATSCFTGFFITKLLEKVIILFSNLRFRYTRLGLLHQWPVNKCQSKLSVTPLNIFLIFCASFRTKGKDVCNKRDASFKLMCHKGGDTKENSMLRMEV